jgi:hypothetical protein
MLRLDATYLVRDYIKKLGVNNAQPPDLVMPQEAVLDVL